MMRHLICLMLAVYLQISLGIAQALPADESHYIKTKVFDLHAHITKRYLSMTGPVDERDVRLAPESKSPFLWIKSFNVEVVSKDGQPESMEYLCHSWATVPTESGTGLLTISQGLGEMKFPAGIAMKVRNDKDAKVHLLVQALNNNEDKIDKYVTYKLKLTYLEDEDARKLGLHTVHSETVSVSVPLSGNSVGTGGLNGKLKAVYPRSTIHFDVPPGRHEFRSLMDSTSGLFHYRKIYFIKLHLHPYGESVEIFDKTANKTVWKGCARPVPGRAALAETEFYSSPKGLEIFKNHVYELIAVYNNTTHHSVDAMAVLRLYMADF